VEYTIDQAHARRRYLARPLLNYFRMSNSDSHKAHNHDGGTETVSRTKIRLKHPKQFKVFLLNDDYTTMEFVVFVLESIFKKTPAEAMQIMLHVHRRGQGVAGVFSKEIAEAKISMVHARAKEEGFPLRCSMEET